MNNSRQLIKGHAIHLIKTEADRAPYSTRYGKKQIGVFLNVKNSRRS